MRRSFVLYSLPLINWTLQIEYLVVVFDKKRGKVQLSLRQADILDALAKDEELCKQGRCVPDLQVVSRYDVHETPLNGLS